MGKMLDAFQQARSRRSALSPAAPMLTTIWPDEEAMTVAPPEEEMPFIEVGGPRDPSERILVMAPTLAVAPKVVEPAPVPAPAVCLDGLMTVRFQPLSLEGMPTGPVSRFAPELIAYHQPDHAISGQYRDLTTSLLVQTPMEQPRTLLFTSGVAGAGTTSVMLNTAVTLVQHNLRRVVVIDAHFKRSAIAARLGLPEAPGLADVLAGRADVESVLRATPLPGLTAVLAGTAEVASPIRLAGERMRSLVWQLREQYDLVLIDAPAWDGRPEMVALGCACDAVYVCVPEKEQDTPALANLLQIIPEQGAPLRGCILTSR